MNAQSERLEVTLSMVQLDESDTPTHSMEPLEVKSGIRKYHALFSRPLVENHPVVGYYREFIPDEAIRRIKDSGVKVEGLHIIVDPSFLEPEYPDIELLFTIRKEFDGYGGDNNIPVTYEGLD